MISKFEEIKSGFIRQAKQQRSSEFFENDSVNNLSAKHVLRNLVAKPQN